MASNQTKINELFMEKLDSLSEKLNEVCVKIAALPGDLTMELDKRYADKRTEKNVDRLSWLVISTVVLGVLAFILK